MRTDRTFERDENTVSGTITFNDEIVWCELTGLLNGMKTVSIMAKALGVTGCELTGLLNGMKTSNSKLSGKRFKGAN